MTALFVVRAELRGKDMVVELQGDVWAATYALSKMSVRWEPGVPPGCLRAPSSWPLIVQLTAVVAYHGGGIRVGPDLKERILAQQRRRAHPVELHANVNAGAPPPRDYQIQGARMIATTGRVLVNDDMGTGKTLTTLLGLMNSNLTRPAVVVCPVSVVDSWLETVACWTPFVALDYRGRTEARREALKKSPAGIIVCSYTIFTRDLRFLLGKNPEALVVDEVHWIKDRRSARSRAVRTMAAKTRVFVGLSGTPITHGPAGLWPALYALSPNGWPVYEDFVSGFLNDEADYEIWPGREREFRLCLHGQHRRVSKQDVLDQLPPKVYTTRTVELPPAARVVYDDLTSKAEAEIDGGTLSPMGQLAVLGRLSQLASATGVIVPGVDGEPAVRLSAPSWKVDALLEILRERGDRQTLVFAPSRQLIELAAAAAETAGYSVGRIVGAQDPGDRSERIRRFQSGELQVMCATTQAGGVGITLTAADAVVFLQRPWSYVEAQQAEDRAHRIGSEKHESIDIIDIVARNTVDETVRGVLKGKSVALAKLLRDPEISKRCLGGGGGR